MYRSGGSGLGGLTTGRMAGERRQTRHTHPVDAYVREQTEKLVRAIVAEVAPLRIVLFGSAARGDMGPCSDLDPLVVMPNGAARRDTARRLYGRIRDVGIPFDIIVATPEDLERYGQSPGLIYARILREGRELYAA